MSRFLYFAYGSNMLTERLARRCPSAVSIGRGTARGFGLRFAKTGRDGSGKGTFVTDRDQTVHGVLYTILRSDLAALHDAECVGRGYDFRENFLVTDGGREFVASTYIASKDAYDENLTPFDWYHALVLAGATQHRLPSDYTDRIRRTAVQPDPDLHRPARLEALDILKSACFEHLVGA